MYIIKGILKTGNLSIVRPEMSYIPRPAGLLLQFKGVLALSNIDEIIWPVVQILADTKGPSQGGDSLCISD